MKKLKALKVELSGDQGVKNVQRAFINLTEIREKFRLKTQEKVIIRLMAYNIKPEASRITVQNYLKMDTEEAQKAGREVNKFHDLLMEMAVTFERAHELGLKASKPATTNGGENKGGNKNNPRSDRKNRKARGGDVGASQKGNGAGNSKGNGDKGADKPKSEKQKVGEKLKSIGLVGKCLSKLGATTRLGRVQRYRRKRKTGQYGSIWWPEVW